jgi:hypothetical protein
LIRDSYGVTGQKTVSSSDSGLGPQPLHNATVRDREAGNEISSAYGET